MTEEEIAHVVATNDKQRFSLRAGRIRANQGHSVPVDLGLDPVDPPAYLYHGTVARHMAAIRAEGLRPMGRHHVHLSADRETATRVGARRGCGRDELILPPAQAEDRLDAYYRHRQMAAAGVRSGRSSGGLLPGGDFPLFELPRELADSDTVGVIYDKVDGLNLYADYGMLRDLFADPALAGSREHLGLLRIYLREDSIAPLPIRRLVAAHPETTDAVFRRLLRKPGFTWNEHGEALLRRRKPWYYANDPRPGVSVIGDRLSELLTGRAP